MNKLETLLIIFYCKRLVLSDRISTKPLTLRKNFSVSLYTWFLYLDRSTEMLRKLNVFFLLTKLCSTEKMIAQFLNR